MCYITRFFDLQAKQIVLLDDDSIKQYSMTACCIAQCMTARQRAVLLDARQHDSMPLRQHRRGRQNGRRRHVHRENQRVLTSPHSSFRAKKLPTYKARPQIGPSPHKVRNGVAIRRSRSLERVAGSRTAPVSRACLRCSKDLRRRLGRRAEHLLRCLRRSWHRLVLLILSTAKKQSTPSSHKRVMPI